MNKYIILALVSVCLFSCDDESALENSIYIPDSQNPGLPAYSELGYNTFGAYYDRQAFTSGSMIPLKVTVTGGVTSFIFSGNMQYEDVSVTLQMNDFLPEHYTELIELHDLELNLQDEDYTVIIERDGIDQEAEILNGTFHFKRTQNLFVDKELFGVVLSGTFRFQAIVDDEPITISDGRFDVSVNENNFFVYEINP